MIGHGKWHLEVPKWRDTNLEFRLGVHRRCLESKAYRRVVLAACKDDILFFINVFVMQFNPLKGGSETAPFITYDFQDPAVLKIVECIEEGKDLLIEKSREMGASWLCLIVMLWLFLFHGWKKCLCVSKSEAAVESEDPDSLFWKVDHILRHLPDWLKPKIKKRKLFYGNLDNHSTITGVASTGDAGVGGRATVMFVDEFSIIRDDVMLYDHSSNTARCRIFNGTHRGQGTMLYELSRNPDIEKLVMHWSMHPDKKKGLYRSTGKGVGFEPIDVKYPYPADFRWVTSGAPTGGPYPGLRSPWYDADVKRKKTAFAVAMDLDIDATGSVSQVFDAVAIHHLKQECSEPMWEGELEYTEAGEPVQLIQKRQGKLKLWCLLDGINRPPKGKYGFGADVALGTGTTPSCLSGVNGLTGTKVLEYRDGLIPPDEFAVFMIAVCRLFASEDEEPGVLCWEAAGPGHAVTTKVLAVGFRNFHYTVDAMKDHLARAKKKGMQPDRPGWRNNARTQMLLLLDYKTAIEQRDFVNRSESSLEECLAFRYGNRGKIEHKTTANRSAEQDGSDASDNHADMVIADALAWMMVKDMKKQAVVKKSEEIPQSSVAWRHKLRETELRMKAEY